MRLRAGSVKIQRLRLRTHLRAKEGHFNKKTYSNVFSSAHYQLQVISTVFEILHHYTIHDRYENTFNLNVAYMSYMNIDRNLTCQGKGKKAQHLLDGRHFIGVCAMISFSHFTFFLFVYVVNFSSKSRKRSSESIYFICRILSYLRILILFILTHTNTKHVLLKYLMVI